MRRDALDAAVVAGREFRGLRGLAPAPQPDPTGLDDNQISRDVLVGQAADGAHGGVVEGVRRYLVRKPGDDDACVRARWEPQYVAESEVSSHEGKRMSSRVIQDLVVRFSAETQLTHV